MVEDNKIADLERAYSLFKRVTSPTSGLGVIRDLMAAHVKAKGAKLVSDEENSKVAFSPTLMLTPAPALALTPTLNPTLTLTLTPRRWAWACRSRSCELGAAESARYT